MPDARAVLEAENKKLAKQVERLRSQLEVAQTRFEENETAIRVLSRLDADSDNREEAKSSSQELVLKALPEREEDAMTPREVHQAIQTSGASISADNVRTILSRLKGSSVAGNEGRYWRAPPSPRVPPQKANGDGFDVDDDEIDNLIGSRRPQPAAFDDDDLDSGVPF
jgi:hypothetical protein